jgi:hypothetical protein
MLIKIRSFFRGLRGKLLISQIILLFRVKSLFYPIFSVQSIITHHVLFFFVYKITEVKKSKIKNSNTWYIVMGGTLKT